ncbi:hypothetical protein [Staphylococcus debuckii]|uniref:hypothetical protein n=1 Tax=Staphylococcus debuckii TaxID=2044912 RepID=UPI0013DF0200|nr:hypothetical protein [Staphylococcus debuckii]
MKVASEKCLRNAGSGYIKIVTNEWQQYLNHSLSKRVTSVKAIKSQHSSQDSDL